jgi:benzodiazapine receptor
MTGFWSAAVITVLVAAAATTGSQYMPGPWYETLNKPSFTPPNWLFPVAWTVLYIMIAAAGWLVWRRSGLSAAMAVWGLGLVLNALWSYLMFGRHDIGGALVNVAALWLSIAAFIVAAWAIDHRAALLFAPYLVWVSFATVLNFAIWRLNA